ncbi:MAG: hypothetical protein NZ583_01665, partial [Desulfobacterota bacterium]|nr:hypothetical protein [Thermodesulfobacteriota bacterium]
VRVHMPDCGHKHIVDIWFDVEKTKFFYWFIPEGEKSGVVGVIADTQDETERILEDFVNKHRIKVIERQKGEIVPIPSVRMPHKDKKKKRILFAGDSCAQVKATTVGGLVSGLKGGIACARSILAGRPVDEFLKPLKKELLVHVIARRILHLFEDEDYDHLIRILNPKFMSILRSHTRDELSKIVLKLFVAQPKLLGVVTKAILRRIFL